MFDEILNQIAEATDKDVITKLAGKFPSLRDFYNLGEKANSVLPRFTKANPKIADLDAAATYVEGWEDFRQKAWDPDRKMTHGEAAARNTLAEQAARIQELEGQVGTEMTEEQINSLLDKKFTERKVVTEDRLGSVLPERLNNAVTKDEVDRYIGYVTKRWEEISAELLPETIRHRDAFGEAPDIDQIYKYMETKFKEDQKRGIAVPVSAKDAYRAVYSEKFAERDKVAREKEIAEAEKRGETRGAQRVAQSQNGRGMPVDGKGGSAMGPVMKRWAARQQTGGDGKAIDAPLGKGVISAVAAEKYLEKQGSA